MTLKEKLEILRGEPIQVFDGNPLDIPCIETSDSEKLCAHPVVSVHMITYNHEPFIRQAIEGVMMQKTDFEFELVIGEDCSQDKTREICFEYQRKYPDKVRVLWWHENVSKLGGNNRRVRAHCRGEYIAFCEGDDYWIDPLKLQKQVDVMRKDPNVGLCFGLADSLNQVTGEIKHGESLSDALYVMPGTQFNEMRACGLRKPAKYLNDNQVRTMAAMCRMSLLKEICYDNAELFSWCLNLGDFQMWMMMAHTSDVAFLPDKVAIYRIHPGGITSRKFSAVQMDWQITTIWYKVNCLGANLEQEIEARHGLVEFYFAKALNQSSLTQISKAMRVRRLKVFHSLLKSRRRGFDWFLMSMGLYKKGVLSIIEPIVHLAKHVLGGKPPLPREKINASMR